MKIKLNEISENGLDYWYNRQTAELNPILADLIDDKPYDVRLHIKPMNSKDYALSGQVTTSANELCSRCGENFDLPINKKLNEILIPERRSDRNDKYARTPLSMQGESDEVSVTEYHHEQLDLGEYLHEAIAIEIPFAPHCDKCQKKADELFIYDEKMGEEEKPNPFQALKGIKLN